MSIKGELMLDLKVNLLWEIIGKLMGHVGIKNFGALCHAESISGQVVRFCKSVVKGGGHCGTCRFGFLVLGTLDVFRGDCQSSLCLTLDVFRGDCQSSLRLNCYNISPMFCL